MLNVGRLERAQPNSEGFRETFSEERQKGPKKAKMAGKKEAKQKAGPFGQTEKNREETESSAGTKNGSRRSRRRIARKMRQLPQQEQAIEAQEEGETACVGVRHVSSRTGWACHMIECTEPYHALRECDFFRSLSTGERTRRVRRLKLCEGCLTFGHSTRARRCPFRGEDEGLCPVRKCRKGHHSLLHDDGAEESTAPQDVEQEEEATCNSGMAARNPVQLMTQRVKDGGGASCLAFWDLGSQVSLVTTQYVQERKLVQMGKSFLKLSGLGSGPALRATYRYKVTLTRTDGQTVELVAHGLETIASNQDAIDPQILRQAFPEVPEGGLEGASGRVSLLIGQDNLRLFPVEVRRAGGMALFKSQFGMGWMASGNAGGIETPSNQEKEANEGALVLVAQESKNFQTPEFLSAEAMGVDLPRRCPSCKNCKECQFRTSAVSYKEDQEFHVILEGLKFNEERRKWTASYPFFIPPSELKDNYQQVKTYTERMEKRLIKQGRVEEFNSQFRDTLERGVFRELSEEELKEWKGPLNYIAMVEAFKNGPHTTTPAHMHEQQLEATAAGQEIPQRLPDEGPPGNGGSIHDHPQLSRAQVCLGQRSV